MILEQNNPTDGKIEDVQGAAEIPQPSPDSKQGVEVPPGFEEDIRMVVEIKEQVRRDPLLGRKLIGAIEMILQKLPEDQYPTFHAAILNDLGNTYADLPKGDRGENLAKAIACYREALTVYTPDAAPYQYATTQNNLGTAYADLPKGDRGENLDKAIACYQEALRFRTPEAAPYQYATTQNNLGNAYSDLPKGDQGENLAKAIACYRKLSPSSRRKPPRINTQRPRVIWATPIPICRRAIVVRTSPKLSPATGKLSPSSRRKPPLWIMR